MVCNVCMYVCMRLLIEKLTLRYYLSIYVHLDAYYKHTYLFEKEKYVGNGRKLVKVSLEVR
jgi:hypothetical protein